MKGDQFPSLVVSQIWEPFLLLYWAPITLDVPGKRQCPAMSVGYHPTFNLGWGNLSARAGDIVSTS